MLKLSIVQGRLSTKVADRYQYFPIHNWRNEFLDAQKIGFNGIEWIISDLSNPIFNDKACIEIIDLVNITGVKVTSISLDLFMQKTLDLFEMSEIKWIMSLINKVQHKIGLKRVSFPIEETSGIRNPNTMKNVLNRLNEISTLYEDQNYKLSIETDLSPNNVKSLLDIEQNKNFGIVLDIGNSAANGYELKSFFDLLSDKIFGIHIKDRLIGCGPTVRLGKGSSDFSYLKNNISRLKNLLDITIQAYRSEHEFINDAINSKRFIDDLLK